MADAAETCFERAIKAMERAAGNATIIVFGAPENLARTPLAQIKPANVEAHAKYVLISKPVATVMKRRCDALSKEEDDHMGGSTSLGNDLFFHHLLPASAKMAKAAKAKRWGEAMGEAMGVFLFLMTSSTLLDNEVWTADPELFAEFFRDFSAAWVACLGQPDAALLCVVGGRQHLVEAIKVWEGDINGELSSTYSDDMDAAFRVRIFTSAADEEEGDEE